MAEKEKFGTLGDKQTGPPTAFPTITDEEWVGMKENPHNWSSGQKWFQAFAVCFINMWTNMTGSSYLSGREFVASQLHVSTILSIVPSATNTLGLAIGPFIAAALSEDIGRLPVYLVTISTSVLFLLGSGITNHIYGIAICRFFVGFIGGAVLAIGPGGSINDLFPPHKRALPLGMFNFLGFTGPPLGFLVSGLVVNSTSDWRYTAWTPLMFGVVVTVLQFFLKETERGAIERRVRVQAEDPNHHRWTRIQDNLHRMAGLSYLLILQRPLRMLFTEPVVTAVGIYTAFSFAVIYDMVAATPYIYATAYGFELGATSLTWISWIVGYFFSAALSVYLQRGIVEKRLRAAREDRAFVVEWVLRPALVGSALVPTSLFWIGWTAGYRVHFIVPTIAMGFYAAGTLLTFNSSLTYLAIFYGPRYGASATAGARMLAFYLGIAFPLFSIPMFEGLGIAWALSLLGFVSVVLLPVPFLLYRYGSALRNRSNQHQ